MCVGFSVQVVGFSLFPSLHSAQCLAVGQGEQSVDVKINQREYKHKTNKKLSEGIKH